MKASGIIVEQGQLSADPASPASGYSVLFPRTDGHWYRKNPDGTVKQIDISPAQVSYYVDEAGLSSGLGATPETAITIDWLMALSVYFTGNEKIYLKGGGVYRGRLPVKSGTVLTKYGSGARPTINGTIPSTSLTWTNAGAGIWTATSSTRVARLFRNGAPETNAQSAIITSTARPAGNQITASSATGLSNVTQMEMVAKEYDFRWKYHTITAYNSGTGNFTISPDNGMQVGFGFRLFNHESLISATGDWAWRGSTVYYKSPGNVNPNTLNVELAIHEEGIFIETGSTDIAIQDIDFFGQALDGVFGRDITNLTINGGIYQHQLMSGVALMGKSTGIRISNINVKFAMANGIVGVNQSNYEYSYNTFEGIGMNANWPYCRDQLVRYDWPVHINVGFAIQNYPIEGGANGYVHHNTAFNLVYNGIAVRTPLNTTVEKNHVYDFCKKANDGAGIYTGSHEAAYYDPYKWVNVKGFKILNNLVHDGQGSFEGAVNYGFVHAFGIYCDNGQDGTEIIGNTSYNNNGAGFICNFYTRNMVIRGNTSYNNKTEQLRLSSGTMEGQWVTTGQIVDNNTFISLGPDQRAVKIMNYDSGAFDPFASGGIFKNNTFISPYTNNIIQKAEAVYTITEYTLSGAQSFYGQQVGQQDSYSDSYSDDATAQEAVPLDVNPTPASSLSITPSGFRSPLNRDFNSTLTPFGAAAYIEGAVSGGGGGSSQWIDRTGGISYGSKVTIGSSAINRDLTIDKTGPPTLGFSRSGTEKALLAVSNTTDGIITGDAAGDFGFRAANQKILFSTDEGATASMILGPSQSIRFPGLVSGTLQVDSSGNVSVGGGGGGSSEWESIFSGAGIEYNNGSYVNLNSTNPDFRLMDPAHDSPFGSMIDEDVVLRLTTNGSAFFQGFSNSGGQALNLAGHVGSTTVSQSAIVFTAFKSNGAGGATTLGSSESLWEVHNGSYSSGNHELRLNGDGGLILSASKYATSSVAMMLTVNNGEVGFASIPGGGGGSSQWADQTGGISYGNKIVVGATTTNRDITIDKTGAPTLGFSRSGTEKALLAVSNTTDGVITGDVAGDFAIRSANQKIVFSTDDGTTASLILGASQAVIVKVLVGTGTRMVVASSTGELSTQTIPSGGGGGGSTNWVDASANSYNTGSITVGTSTINRAITIDKSGAPTLGFSRSGTEKALLAVSNATDGIITGDIAGDFGFRAANQKILFSTDEGATASLILGSSQAIRTPGYVSGYLKVDASGNWSVDSGTGGGGSTPTLDEVTDEGASTTNGISIGSLTTTRLISSAGTPTAVDGPNLNATVTVDGTDIAGRITVTVISATSTPTLEEYATVTFSVPYASQPRIVFSPGNAAAAGLQVYLKNPTTNNFSIAKVASGTSSVTTYVWDYMVVE